MTARPPLPVRFLASALAAGALLTASACSDDDGGGSQAADVPASPVAEGSATPLAAKSPTPSASGRLTEAGARAALITEADIEDDWTKVADAASWRDKLLVGKVDVADFLTAKAQAADCQQLLDTLYGDDLLGKPSGASALTGFEQGDSRLLYQVAAYDRAALDASLNRLKSLPVTCDEFTVTDSAGGKRTVQVTEAPVPDEGDARQGLHVTVQGTAADAPATLTLDIAVVRVGTDAITVTAGGLAGGESDSVGQAVRQGTPRLKDVQAGRTPPADPNEID
ncbi:hypothetical protein M2271_007982 [Streptomyces sp. LBL]|uniref:hypothetical protein n=1 Tax=Streptomyces sp. LBL TaxID=2940562 RepID=UPI002474E9D9|nr:hypothetical protein [Streptomyces sp. LBL]MDH6630131.1 hypothetical protein [Streptomyces sp. LBL]